jgi:hypothetical protein
MISRRSTQPVMANEKNPVLRFGPDEERIDRRHRPLALGRKSFATALQICRDALQDRVGLEQAAELCREAVAAFAAEAHREDIPPERTLAVFKDMVVQLPAYRRVSPEQRGEVIQQLVQVAIDAYYG